MGLYIPPSSGGGGDDDKDKDKESKKSGSIFTRNSSDDSSDFKFYSRPSLGLKIWGPLVPSPDYLPGLYGLTALQTIMGLVMFKNIRTQWYNRTRFGIFSKILNGIAGTYIIFNSGLEISRLSLPYDPWYDEAKGARENAIKQGKPTNFWFGAWDYKPMSLSEWNNKMDNWILQAEREEGLIDDGDVFDNGDKNEVQKGSFAIANSEFQKVHQQLKLLNRQRNSEILQQLNNSSFKDILPNYQTFNNPEFERPKIIVPKDNELKDYLDFEEVWELNDPWIALGQDTEYIVRFIPRFRWIDKVEENKKLIKIAEEKQIQENRANGIKDTPNEIFSGESKAV